MFLGVEVVSLRGAVAAVLRDAGLPDRHAEIVGDALVDAETWGKASHGLMRLPVYVERVRRGGISGLDPVIASDNGAALVLDARNAAGQVAGVSGTDIAVERARKHGVGVVAVRNSNHMGHLAYFARRGASGGVLCGCMSNASQRLSAGVGSSRLLGNNPWAVGVPRGSTPIVVDMANSRVAAGKIRQALASGEEIPEGWALDEEGTPTTDPAAALAGSLLPVGGYKGFSIALLVSVLTAGLAGGGTEASVHPVDDLDAPQSMSQVVWALDPSKFAGSADFASVVEMVSAEVEQSGGSVRLPGTEQRGRRLIGGREVVVLDEVRWERLDARLEEVQGGSLASIVEVVSLDESPN